MGLRAGVFAVALLVAVPAHADQPAYFEANASMTGASNMAIVHGGGAAWYNPAGLHTPELNQLDVTASAFVLRIRDFNRAVVSQLPSGDRELDSDAVTIVPVPSALVYQRKLTDSVSAALGIFVTHAESYDLSGVVDGVESFGGRTEPVLLDGRADINLQRQIYRIGPSVAWAPSARARLGLSALVLYDSLRDGSALRIVASDSGGAMEAATSFRRRTSSFGGQLVLGGQWEPVDDLHLGATVRTPSIAFGQSGEAYQTVSVLSTGSSFVGPGFSTSDRPDLEATAGRLLSPLELVLGAAVTLARVELGAELELLGPLSRGLLQVSHKSQWNLRAGSRFRLSERFALGVGAFTDRSDKLEVAFIGDHIVDYYGLAAGFQWRTQYPIWDEGERRTLTFENTLALRYAAGFGEMSAVRFSPDASSTEAFARLIPTREDVTFHALTLQLSSSLGF